MVRKEGQENGIGVWDVEGYKYLEERIREACDKVIQKEDLKMDVEEILIVGSYGDGCGVRGKSDLDIVILTWSTEWDNRSYEYSEGLKQIASTVNGSSDDILQGMTAFDGLEAYAYPFLEKDKHLHKLASHEPVETYFNLTKDSQQPYYRK